MDTNKEYKRILEDYRKTYDVDSLTAANDRANLDMLIKNQILISTLQNKISELLAQKDSDGNDQLLTNIQTIKKLQDSLYDLIDKNLAIERALSIDRKSRKKEDQESVSAYWDDLKRTAREYLDKIIIYVYCPKCKVMTGRVLPAHDHTSYYCEFQCNQCKKVIIVKREERDVFFDIKEKHKDWRRKYPVEVLQPDEVSDDKEYSDTIELQDEE